MAASVRDTMDLGTVEMTLRVTPNRETIHQLLSTAAHLAFLHAQYFILQSTVFFPTRPTAPKHDTAKIKDETCVGGWPLITVYECKTRFI